MKLHPNGIKKGILFMNYLENAPRPGEFYRHFKGNLYQILAIAVHTETEEPLVIYQALYGDFQIYARPLAMFLDTAENGTKRFVKVVLENSMKNNVNIEWSKSQYSFSKESREREKIQKNNTLEKLNKNQDENQEKYLYEQMEKFFDADSYEAKLECLLPLRGKLNDIMLRNIAVSLDIAIPESSEEEQFQSIVSCLKTMKKYQRSR